jgi:hypothetical protein
VVSAASLMAVERFGAPLVLWIHTRMLIAAAVGR